jgi:hypothetical protein
VLNSCLKKTPSAVCASQVRNAVTVTV